MPIAESRMLTTDNWQLATGNRPLTTAWKGATRGQPPRVAAEAQLNVVVDASVASVAQPRANGNEHQRVAQSRTLEVRTRRNALEFSAREVVRTKPRQAQSASTVATTVCGKFPRTFEVGARKRPEPQYLRPEPPLIAEWPSQLGSGTRLPVPRLRKRMPETPATNKQKTRIAVYFVCNLHVCCANRGPKSLL